MTADAPTVVQPPPAEPVRLSAHPRAVRSIRRIRAGTGLLALAVVLVLSLRAGVPPFDATLRALAWGVGLHFLAWAVAVTAWRHLVLAELELARQRRQARVAARRAAAEAAEAAAAKRT